MLLIVGITGASGAIYGILVAYAMLFPERYVYVYFLIPVKVKYLVIFLVAIEFLSTYRADGIAHFAHLGGMVFGYLYLKSDFNLYRFKNFFSRKDPDMSVHWRDKDEMADLKSEVDRILDKIQQTGYESLTEKERETLKKASDQFGKH